MNAFLPDWMFAAFAIGGWELFNLFAKRFHDGRYHVVGAAIIAVCVVVLCVRYAVRLIHKRRNPTPPNDDDWRNY